MVRILGGDKLEAALKDLAGRVATPATLRVGFLEGATYPDGTSVAMVAAVQNFGNGKIPPRPFFSNMVKMKAETWGPALAKILQANDFNAKDALSLMGEGIKGQLQQSIIETNSPPLAESTLKARGVGGMVFKAGDQATFGAKPLVHTGHMLNSVDFEVEEGLPS